MHKIKPSTAITQQTKRYFPNDGIKLLAIQTSKGGQKLPMKILDVKAETCRIRAGSAKAHFELMYDIGSGLNRPDA